MWTCFKRFRSYLPKDSSLHRAFTLVELLVVVAVITIITAFILFSQNKFDSSTLLRSLAYSVALSMRQAQLYGISVRAQGTGSNPFAPGYGIYFSPTLACPNGVTGRNCYVIFSDLNGNGAYDVGEELSNSGGALVTVGRGYSISKFCAFAGSTLDCYASSGSNISDLTIYFKRPNPDAAFSATCTGSCTSGYTGAFIEISSVGSTDIRAVKITNTGQITVCGLNTEPPNNC